MTEVLTTPRLDFTKVNRSHNILGIEAPISAFMHGFIERELDDFSHEASINPLPEDDGLLALDRAVSFCNKKLRRSLIDLELNLTQLEIIEHHTHRGSNVAPSLFIGDGINAYRFAVFMTLYIQGICEIDESADLITSRLEVNYPVGKPSVKDIAELLRHEWFIELCIELCKLPNGALQSGNSGYADVRMLSAVMGFLQGMDIENTQMLLKLDQDTGEVYFTDEAKKLFRTVRKEHNSEVARRTELHPTWNEMTHEQTEGSTSGCPMRHDKIGTLILKQTASPDQIEQWVEIGVVRLEYPQWVDHEEVDTPNIDLASCVVFERNIIRECSLFLADSIDCYQNNNIQEG